MRNFNFSLILLIGIVVSPISFAKYLSRQEMIASNLAPMGKVNLVEGTSLPENSTMQQVMQRSGEEIYKSTCFACHGTGAAGAPKIADHGAWANRLTQQLADLYAHAINGIRAMPARGGCSNCSDSEIQHAVDYIVNKSK